MKQQVAVLIGTLLIIPGCAKNDSDRSVDAATETTATGAPATAERNSSSDNIGSGSTFDASAASEQSGASDTAAGAGSSVPPASAQAGAQSEPAATNYNTQANPPTPNP